MASDSLACVYQQIVMKPPLSSTLYKMRGGLQGISANLFSHRPKNGLIRGLRSGMVGSWSKIFSQKAKGTHKNVVNITFLWLRCGNLVNKLALMGLQGHHRRIVGW